MEIKHPGRSQLRMPIQVDGWLLEAKVMGDVETAQEDPAVPVDINPPISNCSR